MPKTAQIVEESKAKQEKSDNRQIFPEKKAKRAMHPNSIANLKPWKPGQSGHPGGRVKNDVAAEIARAIFINNPEAIYNAMAKAILNGNAYSFDVVANRGFGKLTEKVEVVDTTEMARMLQSGRDRLKKKPK